MKRLALVAVLALLTGCSGGAGDDTKQAQPVKLRVELTQGRVDEVRHTVQISMHNDGPTKVTVERVELQAPSFKGVGPVTVDAPLPVGGLRVDVPVSYGTGICPGDELKPRSAASHVAFGVRTEDGKLHDVRLPLPDPDPMLDKLLAIDCQQAYLDRQVTLTFGPWTRLPSGWLNGTVILKRVGWPGTVTLQEFVGSILLEVLPLPAREQTPKPYAVLQPGQQEVSVPVVVDGERCTPHALAEIKKPYVFPAWLSLDGGPPLYTELKITDAERDAFKPVIDACAAGYTQM
ncbi:hypothetical protein AB0H83_07445 [Dactylosporangium sp. NPDC050688]|uniref:hypothetical protein n=1 Tax=Dactylosporangium sp. NPDC050688 TaxID=3157217 RepID=UPI0033EBB318